MCNCKHHSNTIDREHLGARVAQLYVGEPQQGMQGAIMVYTYYPTDYVVFVNSGSLPCGCDYARFNNAVLALGYAQQVLAQVIQHEITDGYFSGDVNA